MHTGKVDAKGNAVLRGPRGGEFVLNANGNRAKPGAFADVPPDAKREIARHLGPRDLARFAATSREHRDLVAPDLRKATVSAARARRSTDVAAREVAAAIAECVRRRNWRATIQIGGVWLQVSSYFSPSDPDFYVTFSFAIHKPAAGATKSYVLVNGKLVPEEPPPYAHRGWVTIEDNEYYAHLLPYDEDEGPVYAMLGDPPKATTVFVNSVVSKAVDRFNRGRP